MAVGEEATGGELTGLESGRGDLAGVGMGDVGVEVTEDGGAGESRLSQPEMIRVVHMAIAATTFFADMLSPAFIQFSTFPSFGFYP